MIYKALGLPRKTAWYGSFNRPHHVYFGEPISELF